MADFAARLAIMGLWLPINASSKSEVQVMMRLKNVLVFVAIMAVACSGCAFSNSDNTFQEQPTINASLNGQSPVGNTVQPNCAVILEKITDHPGFDGRARWSPDNRWILFDRTAANNSRQLYLYEVSDRSETALTDSDLLSSGVGMGSWSPDGRKITFFYSKFYSDPAVEPEQFYLVIKDIEQLIANPFKPQDAQEPDNDVIGLGASPEWSPVDNKILFGSHGLTNGEYYAVLNLLDFDTSSTIQITSPDYFATEGRWSPDGQRIVFDSDIDGDYELYVLDIEKDSVVQITDNEVDDILPVWSPDGNYLGFSSNRHGSWDIYAISLDNREEFQITDNPQNEVISDWGSNGFLLFSADWGSTDPSFTTFPLVTPFDEIYMISDCFN